MLLLTKTQDRKQKQYGCETSQETKQINKNSYLVAILNAKHILDCPELELGGNVSFCYNIIRP